MAIAKMPPSRQEEASSALQKLRKNAGYRSARVYAAHLDIPTSTYTHYEQTSDGPESRCPMRVAWKIADDLNCLIDQVVGRTPLEMCESSLQYQYNLLSKSSQALLDEYMEYLVERERARGMNRREGASSPRS